MNHDRKTSHCGGEAEAKEMSEPCVFAQVCFNLFMVKETIYLGCPHQTRIYQGQGTCRSGDGWKEFKKQI